MTQKRGQKWTLKKVTKNSIKVKNNNKNNKNNNEQKIEFIKNIKIGPKQAFTQDP